MINVSIVDDHKLFLESFRRLINDIENLQVIGAYPSAEELEEAISSASVKPDLIFLDLKLRGKSGFDSLDWIVTNYPDIKIIIISMFDESPFIRRAAKLGAHGFLNKDSNSNQVQQAVKSIGRQGFYLPENLSSKLVNTIGNNQLKLTGNDALNILSKTELEVLKFISQGYTAHEIAETVCRSPRTIEGHKQRILEKTQQKNTAALMVWAFRNGLIL